MGSTAAPERQATCENRLVVWLCALLCAGCGPSHGLDVINATSSRVECEVALAHRSYTIGSPHRYYRFEMSPGERWSSRRAAKLDKVEPWNVQPWGVTKLWTSRSTGSDTSREWIILADERDFDTNWPVIRLIICARTPTSMICVEQQALDGRFLPIDPGDHPITCQTDLSSGFAPVAR